jgi:hypothetical protein
MLDPICRTCGERHRYGPCPQHFVKSPEKKKRLEPLLKPLQPKPEAKPTKAEFDRLKYQRELMRKRRAKKQDAATRT